MRGAAFVELQKVVDRLPEILAAEPSTGTSTTSRSPSANTGSTWTTARYPPRALKNMLALTMAHLIYQPAADLYGGMGRVKAGFSSGSVGLDLGCQ